ncbi:MAG: HDOD domain-containing protein [Pseudomonadota bacterium]
MANPQRTHDIRRYIEEVDKLPPLPEAARQLLALKDDPHASARSVAAVIEHDPIIAGQLIRHAASPLFGVRSKIHCIQDAITVLGNKRVMDMAMALMSVRGFRLPDSGPLNQLWFWRHAIYTATLMQLLAEEITAHPHAPAPATAYATGLLHNIGVLVIGKVFPKEFTTINADRTAKPTLALIKIEEARLGATHAQVGMWLLRKWLLPPEFIVTAHEHHNARYKGEFRTYANLAFAANCLLARIDIGDADAADPPANLYYDLKLSAAAAQHALQRLAAARASLETLATEMCQQT